MNLFMLAQQQVPASGREILDHVSTAFRQSDPQLWWKVPVVLGLLGLALVLVWVLAILERRRLERENHPQPTRLYFNTMAVLNIGWSDRWYLWRLARALKLPQPAALLISPAYFDKVVARYCRMRSWNGDALRNRFATIRKTLFGQSGQ